MPQFRILVSAERSRDVRERGRKLVLRGTSPSARLMAHRDVVQPSAPGALRDAPPPAAGDMRRPCMARLTPGHVDACRRCPLARRAAA